MPRCGGPWNGTIPTGSFPGSPTFTVLMSTTPRVAPATDASTPGGRSNPAQMTPVSRAVRVPTIQRHRCFSEIFISSSFLGQRGRIRSGGFRSGRDTRDRLRPGFVSGTGVPLAAREVLGALDADPREAATEPAGQVPVAPS